LEEGVASTLDPKLAAAYKSLGQILRSYKSGKLPKLFKILPQLANWEEVLFLTKPDMWSGVSTFEATKIFCSNLNSKMTQRFYNLVLLPNVRENIATYKKLNYHLYMALKKALFKPAAFFKGVLLPIAEDATSREAVIIGSILAKVSIPSIHASAALIKLTEMEYNIGTGYFIKVLIGKRYGLPATALDMLVDFFCRFGLPDEDNEDESKRGKVPEMPVMWHQTLLTFVQAYKFNINGT
jgi:essential nuclear protein 1